MRSFTPTAPMPAVLAGMGYAALAATLFALLNVLIRLAEPHMSIWHMMFGRSLFGVLAMTLLARSLGIRVLGVHRRLLTAVGVAGVSGVLCLMGALVLLPLFDALVLLYLYPAFAAVLSPWLTGDRVTGRDWGWIALATLGTGIVLWSGRVAGQLQWGHLLGLAAALAYGVSFTLTRRASGANSPLTPFFYVSAVGCLACLGPLFWPPGPVLPDSRGLPALAAIAVLGTVAHLANNKALSLIPSPKVGVISMLEVVFSGAFGFWLFHEGFGGQSFLGAALILAAALGLNTARRPRAMRKT